MPHLMPIIVSEIAQVLNHRFRGSYKTLEVTIVTINRIVYIVYTATSSRPHALIINQKKCFFLYFTLAAVLTYDYQRSLCKVRNRMFITTLLIHSSTVHDPSALKDGLHRLYRWGIIR